MDILDLLSNQLKDPNVLQSMGQKVGADSDQVAKLASVGIPALLAAMERNAENSDGANSLNRALEDHAGSPVNDLMGFLDNVDTNDGEKILQHVFNKPAQVENRLSKNTGLQPSQVTSLLSMLAPLLLSALGQKKKQEQVGASGLSSLLGGLMQQSGGSGEQSMLMNLLDADDDGNIMDDVGNLFGKFFNK
jgi:hypothetical protein